MSTPAPDAFTARMSGPSPAGQVAADMVKRGLWVAPFLMMGGAAIWGSDGAWTVGFGVALILFNFALSAGLIAWSSKISLSLLMASVMFGFLIRLAIIFAAVWLVKDLSWVNMVALGVTIIVTHLGLLFWELRYVSASLSHPGLKPKNKKKFQRNKQEHKQNKDRKNKAAEQAHGGTVGVDLTQQSPTAPSPTAPDPMNKEHSHQ